MQSEGYYLEEEGGKKLVQMWVRWHLDGFLKRNSNASKGEEKRERKRKEKRRFLGARGGNLVGKSSKS